MISIRQRPGLLFISLILWTALACQAAAIPAQTIEVNKEDIVQSVSATMQAQSPVSTAVNDVPTLTGSIDLTTGGVDLQETLIDLYQRLNPSVVHIFVFDSLGLGVTSGSGFVYDAEGHIVTNNHVVADGDSFEVSFADGTRADASVVGTDVDSDLAVIKVERLPTNTRPIPVGNSADLKVGQFVIAIGNPFGEAGSMSIGIISALGRSIESQRRAEGGGRYSLPQVIQTDAAINPGNSGGPLLNLNGEVIGVNSAILTRTGTNSGVGFSIPSNAVRRIAPALIAEGIYTYPFIGISMRNITSLDLQEYLNLPQVMGTYVVDIVPNSPAAASDLVSSGVDQITFEPLTGGDFIIAVNEQPIKDSDELVSYLIFETEVGDTIELTVWRDGEEVIVPLTLGARP